MEKKLTKRQALGVGIAATATINAIALIFGFILINKAINTKKAAPTNAATVVVSDDTTTTTEDPETPDTPDNPDEPGEPNDPEDPGEGGEEGGEENPQTPTIDPYTVYNFNDIKDLLMSYEELNGSQCIIKVKVAGTAFGTPGYCFFTDVSEETIQYSSQITQEVKTEMLARQDVGNNNANFNRGDITVLSGVVSYEHSSYLGVDLVVIR